MGTFDSSSSEVILDRDHSLRKNLDPIQNQSLTKNHNFKTHATPDEVLWK